MTATNNTRAAAPAPIVGADFTDMPCDLRLVSVKKNYPEFALQNVTLSVPRGSVVGLVGRNGAGKTTLMRIVLGSLRADGGQVELFGRDAATMGPAERAALRHRVGGVSAVCPYPASMRVADVAHMYELAFEGFDRAAYQQVLVDLEFEGKDRRRVGDLSRGMSMKLQLACAIASGAQLLVLDEPTAGLDPIVRDEVLDLLRRWMEPGDRSLLVSSHITSDLERICDYVDIINDGRLLLACERDRIDDTMGVARLRASELELVLADGAAGPEGEVRLMRDGMSWAVLVPDRVAFQRAYPDLVCDRASIDDVMTLLVKGEVR